jgi:hypothetical protein
MRYRLVAVLGLSLPAAGCTTPVTMLKNDANGQVARCGGDTSSSIAGGLIGYTIQKNSDERCVQDYQAQGFKRIN